MQKFAFLGIFCGTTSCWLHGAGPGLCGPSPSWLLSPGPGGVGLTELRTLLKWTGLQTRHREHPQARVPRPVSPAHQRRVPRLTTPRPVSPGSPGLSAHVCAHM